MKNATQPSKIHLPESQFADGTRHLSRTKRTDGGGWDKSSNNSRDSGIESYQLTRDKMRRSAQKAKENHDISNVVTKKKSQSPSPRARLNLRVFPTPIQDNDQSDGQGSPSGYRLVNRARNNSIRQNGSPMLAG